MLETRNLTEKPSEIIFADLRATKYRVEVIDGNKCKSFEEYEVLSPLPITTSSLSTNIKCFNDSNGSATLSVNGGTPPYQVNWSNSVEDRTNSISSIERLSAGNYTFQIADNNNCNYTPAIPGISNRITINGPLALLKANISSISNVSCFKGQNGEVKLLSQGGWGNYKHSIDQGISWITSPNFTNLKYGNYRFKISDDLGCTDSVDATIKDGIPLSINIDDLSDVTCFGTSTGKLTLSSSGGSSGNYNYSINDGLNYTANRYFTGLKTGEYPLRVRDINGCEGFSFQKIEQPTLLEAFIDQVANTACEKSIGSATVRGTGGTSPYSYNWSNGQHQTKAINLAYGLYNAKITDKNGCAANASTSIENLPGPKIALLSKSDVTCSYLSNGNIYTSLSSGTAPVNLFWRGINSNSTIISNLNNGTYTAVVTDFYGCCDSIIVNISKPDSLIISLQKQLDPLCYAYNNGIIETKATGGTSPYSYLWSNGTQESTTGDVPSGIYTLNLRDSKDCIANASFTLIDPPSLKPKLPNNVTICSNQTYDVDAEIQNANYMWYSENGFTSTNRNTTLSLPGLYYLLISDSKGCTGKDTLILNKESNIIDANFIMAEKASVGDTIVLIELSWPVPQSIDWDYPASFASIYQTDYSIYLVPQATGKFSIGMTSFVGACSEYIDKIIIIEPPKEKDNSPNSKESVIKDVVAFPNPNRGDFSVIINLKEESDALIEVYSIYGKRLLAKQIKGLTSYKIDINLFQTPGIYLVRVSAGNDFRSLRVIIE
ncbi:MAG: T9SS type A sorting domain-containing protein [Tenuifilaceae bacterium]